MHRELIKCCYDHTLIEAMSVRLKNARKLVCRIHGSCIAVLWIGSNYKVYARFSYVLATILMTDLRRHRLSVIARRADRLFRGDYDGLLFVTCYQ